MKKIVWTAFVNEPHRDYVLLAQCKSSKAELVRRLIADDPIWNRNTMRLERRPMFGKSHFRRGLAIVARTRYEEMSQP